MPEINNALALQVQPPQLDPIKLTSSLAQLQMSQAHAQLYQLQAQMQGVKMNALREAYDKMGHGDTMGAAEGLAPIDPPAADALHKNMQVHREIAAVGSAAYLRSLDDKGNETPASAAIWEHANRELLQGGAHGSGLEGQSRLQRALQLPPDMRRRTAQAITSQWASGAAGTDPGIVGAKAAATSQAELPAKKEMTEFEAGFKPVDLGGNKFTTQRELATSVDAGRAPRSVQGQSPQVQARQTGLGQGEAKNFETSEQQYGSNSKLIQRLDEIDHAIDALGPSWMGAKADQRAQFAKHWNSLLDWAGVDEKTIPRISPDKVAAWEQFNKETVRAGMELIRANFGGSREAASIIQMGNSAVPSVQNSYLGAKYVSSTIRAATQREMDLHEFKRDILHHGGEAVSRWGADPMPKDTVGAEASFNALPGHSPHDYAMRAITSQIPPGAVKDLLADKNKLQHFDAMFGKGTGEYILQGRAQ